MVVLFSASPRRKEILANLGICFHVFPASIPEDSLPGEKPLDYLERITRKKGETGLAEFLDGHRNEKSLPPVLGIACDTIVVFEERILQKPGSYEEALCMLRTLSGKTHKVHTGLYLVGQKEDQKWEIYDFDTTTVSFWDWREEEIRSYLQSRQPFDKAGSYGIQDPESPVSSYEGSLSNVVGFPVRKFLKYFYSGSTPVYPEFFRE